MMFRRERAALLPPCDWYKLLRAPDYIPHVVPWTTDTARWRFLSDATRLGLGLL
jgi:hypothetical protein